MNLQQEREALEKLLADATAIRDSYWEALKNTSTSEQSLKLQGRLTRYEAIRTLIGDLMLG